MLCFHSNPDPRTPKLLRMMLVSGIAGLAGCDPFPVEVTGGLETPAALTEPDLVEVPRDRFAEASEIRAAGDDEQALVLYREILIEDPASIAAYVGIGQVHLQRRDYASAEPAFARATRLDPRDFEAQYGHGLTLRMLKRYDEAVKAYHRALTIQPESFQANFGLATTYVQRGQPKSALVFAEKAVAADPDHGAAQANLGAIYMSTGRYADAISQYQAALKLMDPTPPLLANLITALAQEQRYADVKKTAQTLLAIEPSAGAYERLGWACFRLGEYDDSLEAYRRAVEVDGSHWRSLNGIGCNALNKWLLSQKRDADAAREAREAFRRSLQINPDQSRIVRLLLQYGL